MYEKGKVVTLCETVGLMSKNLQVVSFDAAWHEIYIGTARRDRFIAVCPNPVILPIEQYLTILYHHSNYVTIPTR